MQYIIIDKDWFKTRLLIDQKIILDFFTPKLKYFSLFLLEYTFNTFNYIPKFIQLTVLYDLTGLINRPELLESVDKKDFWYYFNLVLSYIDEDTIKNHNLPIKINKAFLIYLKNKDFRVEIKNNKVFLKNW